LSKYFQIISVAVATLVVCASGSSRATPTESFNPTSDAERTIECFSTYMALSHSADGLEPEATAKAFQTAAYRGVKRMHPYVEAVTRAIGEQTFYDRSARSRLAEMKLIEAQPTNAVRTGLAQKLSAGARQCDHLLDAWGAPAFTGTP
jgi:hypothetical protein